MRALAALVALCALAGASGCAPSLPSSYHCTTDSQCTYSGVAGHCEATGACSFPDGSCTSGSRYGQLGPPSLAGTCVGDGADLGSGGGGGGGGGGDGGGSVGSIMRVGATSLPATSRSMIALPAPSGIAAGDVVFVSIFSTDAQLTITPPSGWTVHADLHGAVGGEFHAAWYYHVETAGELPGWVFGLSASAQAAAAAVVYRGVDGAMPIDVAANQQFEGANLIAPSINTTHANDMLVTLFVQAGSAGLTWTAPSGMQTAVDDGFIGIFDAPQPTAGATGNRQALAGPAGVPNIGAVDVVALTPQ